MSLDDQVRLLSRRVAGLEAEAEIVRRLAGFDQHGAERERLYRFIESETTNFTLTMLCRVCRVSRSAYYSWRADGHSADQAAWDEALVADAIFDIWKPRCRFGRVTVPETSRTASVIQNHQIWASVLVPALLSIGYR